MINPIKFPTLVLETTPEITATTYEPSVTKCRPFTPNIKLSEQDGWWYHMPLIQALGR